MEKIKTTNEVFSSYGLDRDVDDFEFGGVNEHIAHDRLTNETYWRLDKQPEVQQLVALLVKGIIPIADVIKIGSDYYSKEIDLSSVEQNSSYIESEAAGLFLRYIFHDYDHGLRNTRESNDGLKYYHFDFDVVYHDFLNDEATAFAYKKLDGYVPEVYEKLLQLLDNFVDLIEGNSGEQLVTSIIKKAANGEDGLFFKKLLPEEDTQNAIIATGEDVLIHSKQIREILLRRTADLKIHLQLLSEAQDS